MRVIVVQAALISVAACGMGESQEVKSTPRVSAANLPQAVAQICSWAKPDAQASEQTYCVSNRAYGKRRHKLTVTGARECRYHLFGLWDVAVVQYLQDNAITCEKSMRGVLRWTVRAATEKLFDVACDEDSTVDVALHLREDGGLRVTAVAIEDTTLFDLDAKGVLTQTSYVGEQSPPTDDTGC